MAADGGWVFVRAFVCLVKDYPVGLGCEYGAGVRDGGTEGRRDGGRIGLIWPGNFVD